MEKTINKVVRYFTDKILAHDFEVTRISEYDVYFQIDGKYDFAVWLPSGARWVKASPNDSFMNLTFTPEEQQIIYDLLNPLRLEWIKNKRINELKERIKDLELEIGKITS